MRGWGATVSDMVRDSSGGGEARRDRPGLRMEGTWPRTEGVGAGAEGAKPRLKSEGATATEVDLWTQQGMSGRRMKGVGQESQGDGEEKVGRKEKERDVAEEGRQRQERQAGWWYQLMQSSQVYIDQSAEGSKFVKTEKRRRPSERRQNQPPPAREGVVEGAESSQEGEGQRNRSSGGALAGSGGRPSWMGSPPDSVLNQEKEAKPPGGTQEERPPKGPRWGRLFGANVCSSTRAEPAQKTR